MTSGPTRRDDRAVSSTVAHVTALGIMAILVSGLLIAANGVFQHEQEEAAREQLLTIGNRLADELSRASRLSRAGGRVTITTRHQEQVAGRSYIVRMLSGSDCDTDQFSSEACLQLELSSGDTSVKVPIENETNVDITATGSGRFSITASPAVEGRTQKDPATNVETHIGIGEGIAPSSGAPTNLTNREPIAGFTFSPGHPTVDSVIHFRNDTDDLDGIIMSYEWDLGDGTTKTGGEFDYSYSETGKYTVTLNVTDDDGDTDNVSKVVEVSGLVYNEDPQAGDVTGSVEHGRLNFTVTNKHDHRIKIKEVLIDPHNDSIDWLSADPASSDVDEIHIYGTPIDGGHESKIEVYDDGRIFDLDDDGNVNGGDVEMSTGDTAEVDLKGFGPGRNSDPKTNMTDEKVDVALRYEVVSGPSSGQTYTSKFTVFGGAGGNQPPDPDFTYSCTDLDCSFDGTGSSDPDGSIDTYEWDFDDGNTTTGSSPSHTFPSNATYDVSLTVTDDNGTSSTLTKSLTFSSCSGSTGLPWYDPSWHNRKEITVDHTEVAADLTNFPVLVDISGDSDLQNDAQNDGDDVLFAQGCTKLDHEIESFDGSNGDLVAWVNVTSLSSSSDTTFHMYYNNSGASNQENVHDVWGPDYEMVQHFNESSGTPYDSTIDANDGTNNGATQGATGQIDGGYDFSGSGDNVEVPDSINDGAFTIELWYETPPGGGTWRATLFDATAGDKFFQIYAEDDDLDLCFEDDNDDNLDLDADLSLGSQTWHHAVVTAEYGGTGPHEIYVDAVRHDSSSASLSGKPSLAAPDVGYYTDTYDGGCERKRDFDGKIDEVRILSRQLSADWIETEYNNQKSPGSFYTVSDEQRVFVQNEDDTDRVVMEAESYMHVVPGNDDDDGPDDGDDMSSHTWETFTDGQASDNTALESNHNWGYNAWDTRNGERLDYYVDFSQTGTHYVWVRMKCSSGTDDSVHFGINDTVVTFGTWGVNGNSTSSSACADADGWMWATHADSQRVTVDVSQTGEHVINVWMREDGTEIDKIVISKNSGDDPAGTGPDESQKR